MKNLIAIAGLIVGAIAAGMFGGMEYRASKVPGAVVPVAIAGVPLSAVGCFAISAAAMCIAVYLFRRSNLQALHSDPPPTIVGRTVRSLSTGPGFAVTVEVDAARLSDEAFRAAVVTAVQSAISIPTLGGGPAK